MRCINEGIVDIDVTDFKSATTQALWLPCGVTLEMLHSSAGHGLWLLYVHVLCPPDARKDPIILGDIDNVIYARIKHHKMFFNDNNRLWLLSGVLCEMLHSSAGHGLWLLYVHVLCPPDARKDPIILGDIDNVIYAHIKHHKMFFNDNNRLWLLSGALCEMLHSSA